MSPPIEQDVSSDDMDQFGFINDGKTLDVSSSIIWNKIAIDDESPQRQHTELSTKVVQPMRFQAPGPEPIFKPKLRITPPEPKDVPVSSLVPTIWSRNVQRDPFPLCNSFDTRSDVAFYADCGRSWEEQVAFKSQWLQDPSTMHHGSGDLQPADGPTTLMIRNIPSPFTPDLLLQEWPNNGTYDFFYLPYSGRLQRNLTYVFINFTSPAAALEFKCYWQRRRLVRYTSQKPLNIGFADVQGRDENLRQLRKKRLLYAKTKHCQPIVFRNGIRTPIHFAIADLVLKDEPSDDQSDFQQCLP